jgi:3-methyladenine DNA glycosylase AlkC
MAEPLKNHFSINVPEILAHHIQLVYPSFRANAFIEKALIGFEALELLPRGKKLAQDLHHFLPKEFSSAVQIIIDSMSAPLTHTDYEPMKSFFYMPHLNYVAMYGLNDPEVSLDALKFMTTKFSAEFAIRPFIEKFPDFVFQQFDEWKKDSNQHVRRLVSEGTRPLLPWATRLQQLQQNPEPVIPLLNYLKNDPELYVRRSVANHLNDIAKTHPKLVLDVCNNWKNDADEKVQWIIKQSLRTLIKQGNSRAIQILGFDHPDSFNITKTSLNSEIVFLNHAIECSITVVNKQAVEQRAVIDYAIHFMKANGKTQKKVFKGFEAIFLPNETRNFTKSHRFQQLTTRKHYEGTHSIDFLINGKSYPIGEFFLKL